MMMLMSWPSELSQSSEEKMGENLFTGLSLTECMLMSNSISNVVSNASYNRVNE